MRVLTMVVSQPQPNKTMRGGARKGAGRKRGSTKTTMTFSMEQSLLEPLREQVPRGQMTKFVESALERALDEMPNIS
jgi:hypothetical protein